ncbi:hypothetical protein ACIPJ1_04790 [Microbacterium maritypicum]|uniref:hypothetical protein n=1 Tax=Microbacterium maritypicum TaxID=33918 RepID=UPI0038287B53
MSDEPQPELRWAPIEPKPRNLGRIWLIVGLSALALLVVAALLFFLLPRGEAPGPTGSASPSPTQSATPSPSPSSEPEPSMTPVTTPPAPADPTVEAFRGQVQGYLDDALTGLDIVSGSSGQDAVGLVDLLQADAQRLSGMAPPSSIQEAWSSALRDYADDLVQLRSAADSGSDLTKPLADARASVEAVRQAVGL